MVPDQSVHQRAGLSGTFFLSAHVLLSGVFSSGTQRAKKNSDLITFFFKYFSNFPGKAILQCSLHFLSSRSFVMKSCPIVKREYQFMIN